MSPPPMPLPKLDALLTAMSPAERSLWEACAAAGNAAMARLDADNGSLSPAAIDALAMAEANAAATPHVQAAIGSGIVQAALIRAIARDAAPTARELWDVVHGAPGAQAVRQ